MGKKSSKSKKDNQGVAIDPYRVWLAGVGAAARAEDGEPELFEELVGRGRDALSSKGKKVKKKVRKIGEEFSDWFRSTRSDVGSWVGRQAAEAAERVGVPSAEAVAELTRRVEELTRRLEEVPESDKAKKTAPEKTAPKKSAPKKTAPKKTTPRKTAAKTPAAEVHVLFDGGAWRVREGVEVISSHPTKDPAVKAARAAAEKRKAGVLVVFLKNGKVQSRTELA